MRKLINLRNISKTYAMGSYVVRALKSVSLEINAGEFVSIVGPSGSGKSTLLHILGFLDRPDKGEYYFAGHPTTKFSEGRLAAIRSRMAGFVFQSFHLLRRTSARDNVLLPMVYSGQGTERRRALECLKVVGLEDRINHKPNELSGGQCQRVAIARALVNKPMLILADEPTGNLDASSRREVMEIFDGLNAKGMTVVIVTHDEEVWSRTKRIVRMKDGEIVSDEINDSKNRERAEISGGMGEISLPKVRFGFTPAELAEQLKVALRSILSHKMRSALTMLGIFIGVGAIISLMTISEGFMKSLLSGAGEEDAKKVWVMPGGGFLKKSMKFTYSDVQAIRENCRLAEKVVPVIFGNKKVSLGKKHVSAMVQSREGWTPKEKKKYKNKLENCSIKGRFFTKEEDVARKRVAVINEALATKLFGKGNAVNNDVRIGNISFRVVGVVENSKTERIFGGRPKVYIPLRTAVKRVFGRSKLDYIEVTAFSPYDTSEARKQIIRILRKLHPSRNNAEDKFEVKTFKVQIKQFKSAMKNLSLVVYIIAGISLLVGGIGIMNIMLVSVTERTREIGLRKALGAKNSDILGQFLIESVVLCLFGGLLGVGFGAGIAQVASIFIKVQPSLSPGTIAFAFVFSSVIGITFGFWPAARAAMLNPIEALRYE